MSVDDILIAVQSSPVAHAVSKSDHLVGATLQILHVLGLILFLASLVLVGLRATGRILVEQSVAQVAKGTSRLMWTGLVVTAASGTLMFIATPRLYWYNWAFGLKMWLLVVAMLLQIVAFRRIASNATGSRTARLIVTACVLCWFGVAMAGRMIGFV
jgi:hypothetical protein|nr:MAG: hypothetical protein DIU56_06280 [Pseudomonadota bacterium]